ncbi:SPOR domain-containing protein [Vibrio vulnificus]|jgi:septal ring-binding cell division protein DamX|uniref:SPOR domain-containing protein n=1 Tax=Vibrio TaxID=662 RepID=UPI0002DEA7FA|nr:MULTISPECIES: SPOR domain-containing protein [Vibrio]ASJ40754.1 cytochrome C biogenesis protein CcdA [Vibrio vulnificus]ASM98893.1 cytochrome C biogenesis protein CcdA [Vibrio vulnificus NBRC 15645 = ATCC 27562]AUL97951.1 DamX-related protein [Vibrio vulnificus]AVX02424.1 cytochrome C biogenesis protein CcdA [Vibrio vulnificus Env1]EGQ7692220.1 SPOR domain-containing protein [Vibrio vulnificus]
MKKVAIITLSVLLSACASDNYVANVTTESHREEFKIEPIPEPLMAQEETVQEVSIPQQVVKMEPQTEEKKVVKLSPQSETTKAVKIVPPSKKQQEKMQRFGYTVQVVAVGSQAKVDYFASKLPKDGQPIWENYKIVNGTKWFTVLYGDFATSTEAKKAIAQLPQEFKELQPFVKSIDAIKNSEYPTLNKLN